MYTPGQVSDMLDIPSSTLRRYAKEFSSHLSEEAQEPGRKRRYIELDLVILARARKLLNTGQSPKEVNKMLFVVEDQELEYEENSSLALVPGISQAIEAINARANEIMLTINTLEDRQDRTENTQEDMLKRMEALEARHSKRFIDKLLDLFR